MEDGRIVLSSLIEDVHRCTPDGNPLEQVATARLIGERLNTSADELLGYFIDQARRAGHSWSDVGERLGISKQGARQRFNDIDSVPQVDKGDLEMMPRLKTCLRAASDEARRSGTAQVGTHHQLIGLFHEGVAAATLDKLGLEVDPIRATARLLFPPDGAEGSRDTPAESPEARDALASARWFARRAGHDYVGTEHLLFALIVDPGSRSRRVLQAHGIDLADVKRELACYLEPECGPNGRPRRRRRSRGE